MHAIYTLKRVGLGRDEGRGRLGLGGGGEKAVGGGGGGQTKIATKVEKQQWRV